MMTIMLLATGGFKCAKTNSISVSEAIRKQVDAASIHLRTPKGANVAAVEGLSAGELDAVDLGFDWADEKAALYSLTNKTTRDNYTVIFVPPITEFDSSGNYAPSFAVPISCSPFGSDPYCGSVYDKGLFLVNGKSVSKYIHFVWAAELVLDEPGMNRWLVARSAHFQPDYLARATNYGWEHACLFWNDQGKYYATLYHLSGGHPLLPLPSGEFAAPNSLPEPKCAQGIDRSKRIMCVIQ